MKNMGTIIELMLAINNRNVNFFYHKDTNTFDRFPISAIELQNLDRNAKLPVKDENNFCFLKYDDINHKDLMSFYVKECVEDKETRKQLFNILRRKEYVDSFIEKLRELNLYEDFEMICGDIYEQLFLEWAEEKKLNFK